MTPNPETMDQYSVKREKDDLQKCTSEPATLAIGEQANLRRTFSVWSLGALLLCLMATWEALGSVVSQALTSGGAPCLFYNYIISFIGTMLLGLSLAELSSSYPTAGGQYHWVAALAPPRAKAIASWYTGWISIGGQVLLTASAGFLGGLQFQALITVNNRDYVGQRWQGLLFYWLVLAYSFAVNVWGSRLLPGVNLGSGVLHVGGFVAIVCILGVMSSPKHTAQYVFVETSNATGWESDGVAWLVGLISTVYPFLGYDAAAHLAEEIEKPAKYVPLAMVGSIAVNGCIGLVYCIVLLFSLGDLEELLRSRTGFPFIQLFLNVTESTAGATILSLIPTLVAVAASSAGLTSTSRTAWAFARDEAFPFSNFFTKIDEKSYIPLRMCALVTILQGLLGILYVVNTTAFNAILSMAILGMYTSYALPVGFKIYNDCISPVNRLPAAWLNMGRYGRYVNISALLWSFLAILFSVFPTARPVTPQNMNYAIVVFFGWTFLGGIYYIICKRKTYTGPLDFGPTVLGDS